MSEPLNVSQEGLLTLEAVVDQLRIELKAMQRKAEQEGEGLRFAVESAQVELQVVVTKAVGGSGEVEIKVPAFGGFKLGGEGSYEKASVQTLRLTLRPRDMAKGAVAQAQEEAPATAGQASPDEVLISRKRR